MTIIIDGTVGANKAVVLDANSKLPAIDGSQVTALNASEVTTGSIATARIDTGTTTGKVLVLDGSGNMPAIAGGAMTGVSSATKSASDPTVITNPATGLGTKWINTTSGDVYVCTDATTNENVWTNVGEQFGNVQPWMFQGQTYGYSMGGQTPGIPDSHINIEKFSFTSNGGSADVADLNVNVRYITSACNTGIAGYSLAGHSIPYTPPYSNGSRTDIQKFIFATEANATDVGDVSLSGEGHCGASSSTHGYAVGGTDAGTGYAPYKDKIEKFSYAAENTMIDVGTLISPGYMWGTGMNSATYGYAAGGQQPSAVNLIQRWSFSSDGNAVDTTADLTSASGNMTTSSSTTYGYTAGGGPSYNIIDKHQFDTSNNSTDVGDLLNPARNAASNTSTTYGYTIGGGMPYDSKIQKYSFSSDGDSTNVGDLLSARYGLAGIHQ
jgi:hypothetical protein